MYMSGSYTHLDPLVLFGLHLSLAASLLKASLPVDG
jgi:hypothetical protein